MEIDPLLLSRTQFGFTLAFHILFPTLTIGLAGFLLLLKIAGLASGNASGRAIYRQSYRFWVRIFALGFGVGVVTGVVMSYQFGTNFSRFSHAAGNVLGPLLAYEALTAFFLEASFLGVMLFGQDRVGERLHTFATAMVALGTLISSFWILAANSWMQTPQGHALRDGIFYPADWSAIIFNPSFPYRFAHMVTASYIATAFLVAAVCAWYLLRGRHRPFAVVNLRFAVGLALLLAPLQILLGDLHGREVERYQPVKLAAMEGLWETRRGAPFVVLAWPDRRVERNRYELAIPCVSSLLLKHDPNGEVRGLKEVEARDRPFVPLVFFAFRVMVAAGFLMLALAIAGGVLWRRGRLFETRWYLRALVLCGPVGFVAVLAGWVTAETGRQPWLVHGLYRTAQGVTPSLDTETVLISMALFTVVYNLLLGAFLYYGAGLILHGPGRGEPAVTGPVGHHPIAAAQPGRES
jgi:cytochrome d ubiquinol oxidase subunit I